MTSVVVPNVVLNNGQKMPIVGLGTWNVKATHGEVTQAVKDAIDAGYRLIDGAHLYGNEQEVGEGVNAKIAEGVIKREDMFITSKLWNTFHRPDLVRGALESTLKELNTPYVDLYLIHWPMAFKPGDELYFSDEIPVEFDDVDYVDTWKEMEKAVDDGLAKSIGVSNFNRSQLERVLAAARIPPAVNQIEVQPYLNQVKLSAFCASKGISITAYSPLGSPARPWAKPEEPHLLEEPKLIALAQKYGKTVGQVLIRYQTQRGHVVIPKSVNKARIIENLDVFGFELSSDDLAVINSFEVNGRICPMTSSEAHPDRPFVNSEY